MKISITIVGIWRLNFDTYYNNYWCSWFVLVTLALLYSSNMVGKKNIIKVSEKNTFCIYNTEPCHTPVFHVCNIITKFLGNYYIWYHLVNNYFCWFIIIVFITARTRFPKTNYWVRIVILLSHHYLTNLFYHFYYTFIYLLCITPFFI